MSACTYGKSKTERHLTPDVLSLLFFTNVPNPRHTSCGTILTSMSSGCVCAGAVVTIVYGALSAKRALQ